MFQEDSQICAFVSQKVVFAKSVQPATLVVSNEKIQEILYDTGEDVVRYLSQKYPGILFNDYGSLVLMSGIIDSHVHVNEPGRTEWEGFNTATRAAAAGGVTTIADMPLNSIPPTTTLNNLKAKAREAYAKTFVDVAFWGGVVPGNQAICLLELFDLKERQEPILNDTNCNIHSRYITNMLHKKIGIKYLSLSIRHSTGNAKERGRDSLRGRMTSSNIGLHGVIKNSANMK